MTILGPDVASFEHGLNVGGLADAAFVTAKCTEGSTYKDDDYAAFHTEAVNAGKVFIAYHFLGSSDAASQAANLKAHIGDVKLPVMVDCEPEGKWTPTLADLLAFIDAAKALGLDVRLVYLPHWFWLQLGSPSLDGFNSRGVSLVSSAYPAGTGTPEAIYKAAGGDFGEGWTAYGDQSPVLWQFSDRATDGWKQLDFNAFKGTVDELKQFLGLETTTAKAPTADAHVKALQRALNAFGNYGLAVDGQKGPKTNAALKAALGGVNLTHGEESSRVAVLQAALNCDGASLVVDGDFGDKTTEAVKAFQTSHKLVEDGQAGTKTQAALCA